MVKYFWEELVFTLQERMKVVQRFALTLIQLVLGSFEFLKLVD